MSRSEVRVYELLSQPRDLVVGMVTQFLQVGALQVVRNDLRLGVKGC